MPSEMDYEFGKRAVSAGYLTQDQLEECVEILVALERAGSKQRLWQTVQRKAYMAEAAIAEIRARLESASAAVPAAPQVPVAPKPAVEEETADDLHLPARHARGFVLAHVHKGGQTKVYPLPPRLVTLGKGASCDISLSDAGVLELHARLSFREETHEIEEAMRGAGIFVNDERVRSHKLIPYDLVKLGSALLLFLPDYGDEPAAEPADPVAAGGAPCARVRVAEGSREGAEFYLGSSPLVIGRHTLANVHLREASVGAVPRADRSNAAGHPAGGPAERGENEGQRRPRGLEGAERWRQYLHRAGHACFRRRGPSRSAEKPIGRRGRPSWRSPMRRRRRRRKAAGIGNSPRRSKSSRPPIHSCAGELSRCAATPWRACRSKPSSRETFGCCVSKARWRESGSSSRGVRW